MEEIDALVRLQAFQFLEEQSAIHSEVIPWRTLASGFLFEGARVSLVSQQGIFKPSILPEIPLSIRTAPIVEGRPRPYEDEFTREGFVRYRYRGTDTEHRENAGLRLAMHRHTPLVYFYGVAPSYYLAQWPAYVVNDNPPALEFIVEFGERQGARSSLHISSGFDDYHPAPTRAYRTALIQQRMHQSAFRFRVLQAYRQSCCVCKLRHSELLDAAHILPDGHPRGEPWVSNGLALCKLHHAAFDSDILGVRPDLVVEIRKDVLDESDGPLLLHGLQECHRQRLRVLPVSERLKPKPEFLEERYSRFRKVG